MLASLTLFAATLGVSASLAGVSSPDSRVESASRDDASCTHLADTVRLAGVVVDLGGNPLAAAEVVATWAGADAAEASRATCTAAETGTFSLEYEKDLGSPSLSAELGGFRFNTVPLAVGEKVRLVGTPVITVQLDLRRADGSAPETGTVRFTAPSGTELATLPWRGADKSLVVDASSATVTVYADTMELKAVGTIASKLISAPLELSNRDASGEARSVDLYPRDMLIVRVPEFALDRDFDDAAGASVVAVPASELGRRAATSTLTRALFAPDRVRGSVTSQACDGATFFVFDIEPDDYVVGFTSGDYQLGGMARVTTSDGVTELPIEIPDPGERGEIRVRCTAADGAPLSPSVFSVQAQTRHSASSVSGIPFTVGQPGEYIFARSKIDPRPAGATGEDEARSVRMTVDVEGFGSRTIQILDDVDEYELVFTVPVDVELRFIGAGLAAYHLRLSCEGTTFRRAYALKDLPNATLAFEGLTGSKLLVEWVLAKPDATFSENKRQGGLRFVRGLSVRADDVDLQAAAGAVTLAAPEPYSLTINASAFGARQPLTISSEPKVPLGALPKISGESQLRTVTDPQGNVTIDSLGAGTYVVSGKTWTKPLEVKITGDHSCILPRIEANGAVVTVEDPFGALGSAGLLTDDVIVGAGRVALDTSDKAYRFTLTCSRTPTVVRVARGGEVMEIDLDALGLSEHWGGSFAPRFPQQDEQED